MLDKSDFIRYNRQIIIPEFGQEGQEKLKESSVLVIGAGGLGAPILQYLTAAGVGTIGIVEFDEVSLSNLQRQVLFASDEVGESKAQKAKARLEKLNPTLNFKLFEEAITSKNALQIINDFDLVVDGSDNLPTRYLVNDACYLSQKPLIYGAIFRFEGQVSVFNHRNEANELGPNYRDLFPTPPPPEMVPSCSEGGVLGVLPGIIGSLMATETIKILAGIGPSLSGKLHVFDALDFSTFQLKVEKNPENPLSGDRPTITELIDYESFCMGEEKPIPVPEISVFELESKIRKNEVVLVDVREDYEYEIANLGGHLIPLNQIVERREDIPKDQEVVVMCKTGGRSKKAIQILQHEGYENLINLKGGIEAWRKEIDSSLDSY